MWCPLRFWIPSTMVSNSFLVETSFILLLIGCCQPFFLGFISVVSIICQYGKLAAKVLKFSNLCKSIFQNPKVLQCQPIVLLYIIRCTIKKCVTRGTIALEGGISPWAVLYELNDYRDGASCVVNPYNPRKNQRCISAFRAAFNRLSARCAFIFWSFSRRRMAGVISLRCSGVPVLY